MENPEFGNRFLIHGRRATPLPPFITQVLKVPQVSAQLVVAEERLVWVRDVIARVLDVRGLVNLGGPFLLAALGAYKSHEC